MNNPNFQKQLDGTIAGIVQSGKTPRLLLHCCCAPCSSYVLEYLSEYFDITVYFYNPNISPKTEHDFRASELKRLVGEMKTKNPVSVAEGDYEPEKFYNAARGLENEPERRQRCDVCFRLRLEKAAQLAQSGGFDYFCTTLSISPLKDATKLNEIGREISAIYGVPFLPSDFKKRGGYKRSIELSATHQLYRQNYCGCVFSKREAEKRTADK